MSAIQRACLKLEPGYNPGITFIVVQKRHHARFFVQNRDHAVSANFINEKRSSKLEKFIWFYSQEGWLPCVQLLPECPKTEEDITSGTTIRC